MKSLEVALDYGSMDASVQGQFAPETGASAPFPFRVMDMHGGLLAEGAVNSQQSTRVLFEDPMGNEVLFVRLLWPNGSASTQVAHYGRGAGASVQFSGAELGGAAWAKWATPRLGQSGGLTRSSPASRRIDRLKYVWLRLWSHHPEGWRVREGIPSLRTERGEDARQIDLQLSAGAHLLQLGGAQMPWVFVALPGDGPCRVLLTPNPAVDPKTLPLKIVVTSFRPEAESIAEFLSRDALRAADLVGHFGPVAQRLLHGKVNDSISAIVGAYYLLRVGRWKDTPADWFQNLYEWYPWSADAALIKCALTVRRGLATPSSVRAAFIELTQVFERGVPLFEEAHRLMIEVHSILRSAAASMGAPDTSPDPRASEGTEVLFRKCESFANARAWTGPSFSYFGHVPGEPSAKRLRGAPPYMDASDMEPEERGHQAHHEFGFSSAALLPSEARRRRKSSFTYLKDL